jgi:heme-degrading monooxygenase HmoA
MPALPWTSLRPLEPDRQYHVFATTLPLNGPQHLPRFMAQTAKIRRQLADADGLVGYSLNAKLVKLVFYTLSVWESAEHMGRFAAADPHAAASRSRPQRMGRTVFLPWSAPGAELPPTWDDVIARLAAAGGTASGDGQR